MSEWTWRWVLFILGAQYLAQGAWAAVDPQGFTNAVADFGPTNEHLIRDFAAAALTFGVALVLGARLVGWRTPALALTTVWTGLHAVSHVVDVTKASPAPVGPVEAILLVLVTGALAVLTRMSVQEEAR